jgi:ClpP class serine protease
METEVAAIKEKVSFFSVIYDKFDNTIEKLDKRTTEDRKELQNMIDELHVDLLQEIKALREESQMQHIAQQKKIDELNKLRWLIVGAAAVIGWVVSKAGLPFDIK